MIDSALLNMQEILTKPNRITKVTNIVLKLIWHNADQNLALQILLKTMTISLLPSNTTWLTSAESNHSVQNTNNVSSLLHEELQFSSKA